MPDRKFKQIFFLVQVSNGGNLPVFNICAKTFSKNVAEELQEMLHSIDPSIKTVIVSYSRAELAELGY